MNAKTLIVMAAFGLGGFVAYKTFATRYAPITVAGEVYTHVDMNEVNKVENHFFTPQGVPVDEAGKFIQISKYDHPELTAEQIGIVQAQVVQIFGLKPIQAFDDRFSGMFRGKLPIYGYMGPGAFVLHLGPETSKQPTLSGTDASGFIDHLARIPTNF